MEIVGDTVYVANAGTGGTSAPGIVTIDVPTLTITGSFAGLPADDISYWDVQLYNGELLVSNSDTGNDGIERYAFDGTFLGFFAQSDGVASFDMIEQLAVRSNNNVLGAGFTPPSGVYEFTPDGTSLGIVAGLDFGPRGVAELGNGSILWTNGSFLQTDSDLILDGLSFRYISQTTIPAPASILVLGGLLVRRRRR